MAVTFELGLFGALERREDLVLGALSVMLGVCDSLMYLGHSVHLGPVLGAGRIT